MYSFNKVTDAPKRSKRSDSTNSNIDTLSVFVSFMEKHKPKLYVYTFLTLILTLANLFGLTPLKGLILLMPSLAYMMAMDIAKLIRKVLAQ